MGARDSKRRRRGVVAGLALVALLLLLVPAAHAQASDVTVTGTFGDDHVVVTATSTDSATITLNGVPVHSGSVDALHVDGGAGDDTLTIENPVDGLFAPAGGIDYHGGPQSTQAGDSLEVHGGAADTGTDSAGATRDAGTLTHTRGTTVQTIRYDGIEPLTDIVPAATLVINGTGAGETIGVDNGSTTGDGQIRVTGSDFESVEFANKTSVTVNGLGGSDTFNITNSDLETGLSGDMKIDGGGQTGDAFTVGPANYTGGGLLLVDAGGGVTDANAGTDVTASRFGADVGTGVGTSLDPLDTVVSNLEASTTTGGIFVGNTGGIFVGGVSASLTGLTVTTSGDITLTNSGSIALSDTDGLQIVKDGTTSGDVSLTANGAAADIIGTVDNPAVSAPHGSVSLDAGRDVSLGTVGPLPDNGVRANGNLGLQAGGTVTVDGTSQVVSDAFGNHTGGSVTVTAITGDVNVTAASGGDNAHVRANGTTGGDVLLEAMGAGKTLNLTAPRPAVSSQAGSVTAIADHIAIDPSSGIQASGTNGFVALQPSTSGTNADLGATVDTGFDLSDAELDTITTPILRVIAGGGAINVSNDISPAHATNLSLDATGPITQSGLIAVTGLQARSDLATVTLTNPNNEVTNLAGATHGSPGSNFTYVDNSSVTVNTIDGQNGIATDDGDITVTAGAGGGLTVNQPITATGSHQTILSSGGSATQGASGNITSAGLKLTGAGSFDFENVGNAVGVLAGNPAGSVTFSQGVNLTIGTAGGTDGISTGSTNAVKVTTAGADLTVTKNVAAGGPANLAATGANHTITNVAAVSGTGTASTLLADRMVLAGGTVNVGSGTVSIAASTAGRQIDLGSTTDSASGKLELSDAELDTITAGTLDVGSTTNGDITFTAPISPANAGLLILMTGGSVVDGNPGTDVTVSKLGMKASGNVGSSGAIDTAVSNLEASGPGGVSVANSGAMTIGGVTSLLSGIDGGAGGTTVSNDADITASEGVTSTSITSLSAGGSEKRITNNSTISGNTLVSLAADQMALAGGTTSSTSSVTLEPSTGSHPIDLGSTVDTAGALRLSDTELDTITAPLLTIATTGTVTVSSAITLAPAKVPTLFISGPGGFSEGAPLSAHALRLDGGGVSATQANDVDTLAGAVTSGNYSFTDTNGLTTGAVAGESGVSTAGSGGKITLDTGGSLAINQGGLNAGSGDGKVTAGGPVTQDAAVGALTINHLELLGAGPYTLTNTLNNLDTLSGDVTGALNVVDKDQVTIATAGGTSGLHTSNAPISVTALNGQILAVDTVDAGSAAIALRAAGTDRLLHLAANLVGGSATLTGDKFTYDGIGTANLGTGSGHDLQIQPDSAGRPIDLGSTSDPSGSMNVSDAELDKLTANTITLGRADAGLFTVSQSVSPAHATLLALLSGGGFTNGGSGSLSNGALALSDGSSTARTWTLAPGTVSDGHPAIPYSGVSNLSVNGGSGADIFNVKASPDAAYAIDGGAPTSSPGDTLNYDAESRPVSGDSSPPDGDISSPGRKDVAFTGIEAANLSHANNTADLSTSVSDSPDPVNAGGVVTYHMHIQNGGPLDASQPRLAAPIPSGTKLVGAGQTDGSAFHCTSDGTTVTCAAASLASGGSAAIDMAVKTARSQQGTIALHPSASSSTSDADHSNDASSETTTITPAPTRVTIGRTVTKRRSGSITVAIGCQGFPARTCPVTVTVSFRSPHGDLAPITSRKTIKTGRRSIVFVIGSRSERRRIKRIHSLAVHVAVTNRKGLGATRDATASGP